LLIREPREERKESKRVATPVIVVRLAVPIIMTTTSSIATAMAVRLAVISATAMVSTVRVGGVDGGTTAPTVIKGATVVSSSTVVSSFSTLATVISSSFATLATIVATTRTVATSTVASGTSTLVSGIAIVTSGGVGGISGISRGSVIAVIVVVVIAGISRGSIAIVAVTVRHTVISELTILFLQFHIDNFFAIEVRSSIRFSSSSSRYRHGSNDGNPYCYD